MPTGERVDDGQKADVFVGHWEVRFQTVDYSEVIFWDMASDGSLTWYPACSSSPDTPLQGNWSVDHNDPQTLTITLENGARVQEPFSVGESWIDVGGPENSHRLYPAECLGAGPTGCVEQDH